MTAQEPSRPWINTSLSVEQRVDLLLEQMTLAEKVAQLGSVWIYEIQGDDQSLSGEKLDARLGQGIGRLGLNGCGFGYGDGRCCSGRIFLSLGVAHDLGHLFHGGHFGLFHRFQDCCQFVRRGL